MWHTVSQQHQGLSNFTPPPTKLSFLCWRVRVFVKLVANFDDPRKGLFPISFTLNQFDKMELNLASSSEKPLLSHTQFHKNKKNKGSWKKKHRQQLIHKAKLKSLSNFHASKTREQSIQAEEFQSGVEKNENGEEHSSKAKEVPAENDGPSKKRRVTFNVPNNGRHENDKSSKSIDTPVSQKRKRPRQDNVSNQCAVPTRPDQTPEAINASLKAMGAAPSTRTTPPADNKNDNEKPSEDSDSASDSDDDDDYDDDDDDDDNDISRNAEQSFEDTGLYRSVCYHMKSRLGMDHPTEVQRRVLKETLNLKDGQLAFDILVRSPTGSGKTFAYLLPICHYLLNRTKRSSREDGALAIIVVPTHELADQVAEEAERLFRPWHWIVVGHVTGGENKRSEKARLRRGVNVLVATPGRLLDHMRNTQSFLYRLCEFLVLDEADRLLDMGFEAEVKEIVQNLDNEAKVANPDAGRFRSNVLLSATLRKDVERLTKFSLQEPVEILVSAQQSNPGADEKKGMKFSMPLELRQHFCVVEQKFRLVTLACFLRLRALKDVPRGNLNVEPDSLPTCKVIVFFSTCDSVDFHYDLFNKAKQPDELRQPGTIKAPADVLVPLKVFRLHGNHSQTDRTAALRGFRKSHRAVLLCTDVAARGLDLKGLTFSIQYDPPTGGDGEELEYMHRAGRTARIGTQGDALLFLLPSERAYVSKLNSAGVDITEISGSAALAALYPQADLTESSGISYATRLVTSAVQNCFDEAIADNEELKQEAVAGFQAYCRAYATHAREVRHFFHVRNLHLGHVARAFVLSDKPAEFAEMMTEIRKAKAEQMERSGKQASVTLETKSRGEIARAIAEGERQPFNQQNTELARRRREKGSGVQAYKEMAMEFGA